MRFDINLLIRFHFPYLFYLRFGVTSVKSVSVTCIPLAARNTTRKLMG